MNSMTQCDDIYMRRCLQLAANGAGSTSPNPMVGAVIVCDGRIIGEGYHIRAGEPHAEVNAVRSVAECDKHLLKKSTMYVSLEPCSHFGKTPPCCDLIISCGIPRVVIGTTDSNSQVNGNGIKRMKAAGIDVTVGLLSDELFRLNRSFFTLHGFSRPYITLKWAETQDGFIDTLRTEGDAHKISNSGSMLAVHKLRAEHDAILVGTRTALSDNPSLTLRHWAGRTPLRLVIDRKNVLPTTVKLFDGSAPTVVYTMNPVNGKFSENIEQVRITGERSVALQIVEHLASRNINSLLVEGGAYTLQRFIDEALWDEIRVERNPRLTVGDGVKSPILPEGVKMERSLCFGNEIFCFTPLK